MKICIYGAGAIGAWLGLELARSGEDVTLIARGPHLKAMQENGVKILIGDEERIAHPRCVESPRDAGPQDFVILTLKAPALPGIAENLPDLFHDNTAVVTAVNGIPWWYAYGLEGPLENRTLESVDPSGKLWSTIGPERAIGCVVYPATEIIEPGVIRHIQGDRFALGEPTGETTDRLQDLSKALKNAGFTVRLRDRIRDEIWVKLWGNLCFNPISALTGATLDAVVANPGTAGICREMMQEAKEIGEAIGVRFPITIDKRLAGAAKVGAHKTSMLQDLERGRTMEIDALVTVVQELGRLTGTQTPTIDTVLALIQQRAREAGLY
ncbi:2-dehydropantoate 2-reductase [Hyphococcus sp.]|uniref:2-dehydropantoate 2-reductase n=1 Tax=Hyphococcus sp. TaxID=2038636 RepID=UPI003CCBD8C5